MPPHGAEASSRRSFGSPARKVCPTSGSQIRLECQFRSPGARQNSPSFHEKHETSLSQRDAASSTIKQLRFVPGLKRCNRVADCHGGKTFWSWFCARTGRGSGNPAAGNGIFGCRDGRLKSVAIIETALTFVQTPVQSDFDEPQTTNLGVGGSNLFGRANT